MWIHEQYDFDIDDAFICAALDVAAPYVRGTLFDIDVQQLLFLNDLVNSFLSK
jgi:hypothetical protein